MKTNLLHLMLAGVLAGLGSLFLPQTARAHCDTMDGPVVIDARAALDKQDITPVLKWVAKEAEPEIRLAFTKTLAVRTQSAEARELADRYLFETLVRVHRAGEGAPFTGLKPAGTDPGPAVKAADQALATGAIEPVIKLTTDQAAAGIRQRFAAATEAKKHAAHNVAAGREYVAAYVEYVHYVERVNQAAQGPAAHHAAEPGPGPAEPAHHDHGD